MVKYRKRGLELNFIGISAVKTIQILTVIWRINSITTMIMMMLGSSLYYLILIIYLSNFVDTADKNIGFCSLLFHKNILQSEPESNIELWIQKGEAQQPTLFQIMLKIKHCVLVKLDFPLKINNCVFYLHIFSESSFRNPWIRHLAIVQRVHIVL